MSHKIKISILTDAAIVLLGSVAFILFIIGSFAHYDLSTMLYIFYFSGICTFEAVLIWLCPLYYHLKIYKEWIYMEYDKTQNKMAIALILCIIGAMCISMHGFFTLAFLRDNPVHIVVSTLLLAVALVLDSKLINYTIKKESKED